MSKSKPTRTYIMLSMLGAAALLALLFSFVRPRGAAAPEPLFVPTRADSPPPKAPRPEIVVGVEKTTLYADPQAQNRSGRLELGTQVDVQEVREGVAKVAMDRLTGWVL